MDPFAGAGNLIFEAKELGLNYNPVAYIIMKSILEYPPKYGAALTDSCIENGEKLREMTRELHLHYASY